MTMLKLEGNLGEENYTIKFNSKDDLYTELERRENNTIRPLIKTNAINFLVNDDLVANGYQPKFCSKTQLESRVFLKIQDVVYPVAQNAFISTKQRIDLSGSGLFKLTDVTLKNVLNELIHKISQVRIVVIDNMVRAIFSGDENRGYAVMPIKEVVEYTMSFLDDKFKNFEFQKSIMTYDTTSVKVLFPEHAEILQDLYGTDIKYTPGVMIYTSDTGFSSNYIYPIWDVGGVSAVFGTDFEHIKIVHKGKNTTLDSIGIELPKIFSKFRNTISLVKTQVKYKVKYPETIIKKLAEKLNLSKQTVKELESRKQLFDFMNCDNPDYEYSAYDFTKLFIEMAQDAKENNKDYLEVLVGQTLHLDFEKIDDLD